MKRRPEVPETGPPGTICFGPFHLDVAHHALYKDGVKLAIGARALDLLIYLAERPGQLVSKRRLMDAVWSETVVTENAIARSVKEIRRVLHDDARNPAYIETIARRGLRFVGEVSAEARHKPRPSNSATLWVGLLVAVLLMIATAGWVMLRKPVPAESIVVAVLPLKNNSGNAEQEFISDGLTEELIARLGRINSHRVGVIASTSAFSYKRSSLSAAEIAQALNADYLIEGSVRWNEDRIMASIQLIDAGDQIQVWSKHFQQPWPDRFSVQNAIAQQIANELAVKLIEEQPSPEVAPEAYVDYLKGHYFFTNWTEHGFSKALDHYHRAIAKDPGFALAYAGLSNVYGTLGFWGFIAPQEADKLSYSNAQKALELDPQASSPNISLAMHALFYRRDIADAKHHLSLAQRLNPSNPDLILPQINLAWGENDWQTALKNARRGVRLDPMSPLLNTTIAYSFYFGRRYDEAIQAAERVLELNEFFPTAHATMALAAIQLGRHDLARASAGRAREYSNDQPSMIALDGMIAALTGDKSTASDAFDRLSTLQKSRYISPLHFAWVLISLNREPEALGYLRAALDAGSPDVIYLPYDPLYDNLRPSVAFAELSERARQPVPNVE